ncbi:alpha/beta fold hydrolase [Saccharopolyspora indica]|uniref:thioesterase II family protein n=1 Tax=Saccharopolyspora indica TaxID=1229659 RepID=UPI0022EA3A64|nr:alpha/beta fold hydrolase [Saccharopolyspora indica]MDA3648677.1 alpha/beta fold hydrolase [Saccharopolyspora indica]
MTERLRLLCFPYAGGNAQSYVRWRRPLEPDVEVCPMQLPGHGERIREAPRHRWEDLLADTRDRLARLADRPIALFGHSLGALLAFECARMLVAEHGVQPVHLLVSGHRAAQLPMREEVLHHLPDAEFLEALSERSRTLRALTDPEFRRLLLPVLRADFTASETYEFAEGPPLTCPVTALGGEEDPDVDLGELDAWRHRSTGPFELVAFPGDHFFVDDDWQGVVAAVGDRLRPRTGNASR